MMVKIAAGISIWLVALAGSVAGGDDADLSNTMRSLLLQKLPEPLYEKSIDWDKTKDVHVLRVRHGKPVVEKVPKNDGVWKRIKVTAINPKETLKLVISEVAHAGPNTTTFTLRVADLMRFEGEQQHWDDGIKFYGVSLRARAEVSATLHCEVSMRTEFWSLLPGLVCTVHVKDCSVGYDKIVVEHIAGLGGEAAKILGTTGLKLLHQWKPSIERHLLEKANAAVMKAGQNREIRLGLQKLAISKP